MTMQEFIMTHTLEEYLAAVEKNLRGKQHTTV